MSFARTRDFFHSLAFRLTVYNVVVLIFALSIVYLVSYYLVSSFQAGRADTYLSTEMDECTRIYKLQGVPGLMDEANTETGAVGKEDLVFRIYDLNGGVTFQTDMTHFDSKHKGLATIVVPSAGGARNFSTIYSGDRAPARLLAGPLDDSHLLVIVMSLSDDVRLINDSMRLILLVMLATGLIAVVLGYLFSRRALAGVLQVQRAADDIAGGKVERRAPVAGRGDEVDRLALAFNAMASRVEALLTQLRDANDQLAHELRSPLTHIRGRCELALTHAGNPRSFQEIAGETVEACDRLLRTINTILELSETESGMNAIPQESVRLDAMLQDACELFAPLAQDAGVNLSCHAPQPTSVIGAGPKLQRLFSNLLDNAIKYTPSGGTVAVALTTTNGQAIVTVRDTGPGIDPADMPHIFERFYRGQKLSRTPGNGLGLTLARSIARAHRGDITARTASTGSAFIVTLPRQTLST